MTAFFEEAETFENLIQLLRRKRVKRGGGKEGGEEKREGGGKERERTAFISKERRSGHSSLSDILPFVIQV